VVSRGASVSFFANSTRTDDREKTMEDTHFWVMNATARPPGNRRRPGHLSGAPTLRGRPGSRPAISIAGAGESTCAGPSPGQAREYVVKDIGGVGGCPWREDRGYGLRHHKTRRSFILKTATAWRSNVDGLECTNFLRGTLAKSNLYVHQKRQQVLKSRFSTKHWG